MPERTSESKAVSHGYLIRVIGNADRAEPLKGSEQGAPGDRQEQMVQIHCNERVAVHIDPWVKRGRP